MILLDKFQDDAAPIPNAFESPSHQVTKSPSRDASMIPMLINNISLTRLIESYGVCISQ